jgi:hypothetical protein
MVGGSVALLVDGTSYPGVVTGATTCYFELTAAQTALLEPVKDYDLIVTLANTHILTPATGLLIVD